MPRRSRKRGNQIPILRNSDTSDESTTYTPVDTTSESAEQQVRSSPRSSQRSLNFEDSEEFVEPTPPSRKKKNVGYSTPKSRGGIQKTKGKNSDLDFTIQTPTKARSRGKRVSQSLSQNSDDGINIYFLIRHTDSLLDDIVDNWIKKYKENREDAIQMLIQFFIDLSGCKGRITPEMRTEMEINDIINRLIDELDEKDAIKYPLMRAGQEWKEFHVNFCEFLELLVKQCHKNKIIYDNYFFENVIPFLISLSESQVRTFRHTATLAVMKLTTALVDVIAKIYNNLSGTDWEYMDERQHELDENVQQMRRVVANMFESVFVHRFKDIRSEIRAICMEEMGLWIKKLPQDFFNDNCLKYIGWNLFDSFGEVRLKCVQALQPLYASEDWYPKLKDFNIKFKNRIVNMTHDKENEVAVEAMKIVNSILKHQPTLFTDHDNEKIFELVFEAYQPLARASGEFLYKSLCTLDEEEIVEVRSLIQDLVLFYAEAAVPGHADLLVDSLMEANEMMKDWECMTDLLLEDTDLEEKDLEIQNKEKSVLIELMVCCIKQAATGEVPERRLSRRKMSTREQKQVQADREKLTKHFIQNLPHLLSKYKTDPEKLANLLVIPQYFDLYIYGKFKEEEILESLLSKMVNIVENIDDSDVLDTASKTFECMCTNTEGHPNFARCDLARTKMIDAIVKNYKTTIQEYRITLEAKEEIDATLLSNATQFLKQIALFYMNHNLNNWKIWDSLFTNIVDAFSTTDHQSSLSDEAVKYCITSCYFSLLWGQEHLFEWADSDSQSDEKFKILRKQLDAFMELMCNFIGNNMQRSVPEALREDAFIAFCDLLAIFCNQLQSHSNPLMHQLIYTATPIMHNMMQNFLQQFVFVKRENEEVDEPSSVEDLAKRRNFLASYCKLIVYNIITAKEAVLIFKNYIRYKLDYGDLIKETLIKTRDMSRKNCALIMQYSLNTLYTESIAKKGKVTRNSNEFFEIKELATQFSVFLGNDGTKNRDAMIGLHKVGIRFAFTEPRGVEFDPKKPPANLSFLEILSEFTNKLLKNDKLVVLNFLNDHIQNRILSSQGDDWKPLGMYKNSLLQSEKKIDGLSGTSKKKKPRKPELTLSKITLPRPSTSGNASNLEIDLIGNEDDEVSPMPSIEDSSYTSSPLYPLPRKSNTGGNFASPLRMEINEIIEESVSE